MESTGGQAALTAFMEGVNRFNGSDAADVLDAQAKETFKSHSVWLYNAAAMKALRGEIWNWGMDDPVLAKEIDALIPGCLDFGTDGVSEQLYFRALRMLPYGMDDYAGKTVLEIGSGMGEGLNLLSRVVDGGRFLGVELSSMAVRRANAIFGRGDGLRYIEGDAEALPLGDEEADVIISVESAHNYPDLPAFLSEVARVLKPGGYFSCLDGYTKHRYDLMSSLKRGMPAFEWLLEDDISAAVRAGIRKRLSPDSYFRQTTLAARGMNPLKRHVYFHAHATAFGSKFIKQRESLLIRVLNRLGKLPASWTLPVESYVHSVARKRPA